MTEFGKTKLYDKQQLENFGYNIAIYPVTSLRLSNKAVEVGLQKLRKEGTNAQMLDLMQTREQLYELLKYEEYSLFDENIYDFEL